MKLRLTQAGFESYTGQMGVIFFEDGLSTADVLTVDAVRMAAVMGCEWEDGSPANISQIYLDNMHTPASLVQSTQAMPEQSEAEATVKAEAPAVTYTEEQLAAIADKSGIAGLRAISEPLGVKGNSIRGLIDGILKIASAPKAA